MAAAGVVVFLVGLAIPVHTSTASLYDDNSCGPAFAPFRRFGAKHLAQMTNKEREAVKECYNISDKDAQEREVEFEERRRQCIGLHFPDVQREDLESHLCNISQPVTNNDTLVHTNVTNCVSKAFEKASKETVLQQHREIFRDCVLQVFPEMSERDALYSYAKVLNRIRDMRAPINALHAEITNCFRELLIPEVTEQDERKRLKIACMKQMQPDVPPEELASVFEKDLYNGSTVLDDKLSLCIFMASPLGKWAQAEMEIGYQCLREIMPLVHARQRPSLFYKFGLDVQKEFTELAMACESKGGFATVQNGIRRPGFLRCILGVKQQRSHEETLDASFVYDNPNPNQKLELCLKHKRSASPAFIQYREYMKAKAMKHREASDCYNKVMA